MIKRTRQLGLTLVEMTVVIAIAALMVALTIPAANMLLNSFESESGAKSIISAALSSARAIAAKEQRYAGIRFQKRYDPNVPDQLNVSQYIIFIVQDPNIMAYGFKAVEGIQPIKLPDSIGVMDLIIRTNHGPTTNDADNLGQQTINDNSWINGPEEVNDTTAFSIVFSPSGKLVIHPVRVRNRNGESRPDNSILSKISMDDIFNSTSNIANYQIGMFVQDDYAYLGFGKESSRNSFIIYETNKLKDAYNSGNAYSGYLNQLKQVFINPYTGTLINEQ
jgi:type II secretory pathway pseudopilin PulG